MKWKLFLELHLSLFKQKLNLYCCTDARPGRSIKKCPTEYLDGCFTQLRRIAHNVDSTARIPNTKLYVTVNCITAKRILNLLAMLQKGSAINVRPDTVEAKSNFCKATLR